jgi:hypothetical protein
VDREKLKQRKRNQGWGYKNGNTKETTRRRQDKITKLVVRKAWLAYPAIMVK